MIKTRLKDVGIKITELADYLQISRPTMYKFIDTYDVGDKESLSKGILDLFTYIDKNLYIGRKNVISYIFDNLAKAEVDNSVPNAKVLSIVKDYINKNGDSEKTKFIADCCKKNTFDDVICYLVNVEPILKKKKRTNEEEKFLKPYFIFIKEIKEVK